MWLLLALVVIPTFNQYNKINTMHAKSNNIKQKYTDGHAKQESSQPNMVI